MDTSIVKAKDIVNFSKTEYGQLASHARGLIVKDMNKGVMQNGKHRYKSKEYAARKATGKLGKFRKSDSVTMLLSGNTKNAIFPEGKKDAALIIFGNGVIVEANEKRGYIIRDLSKKNRLSSVNFMQRIVNRKIKKYASKPINIKIGK